jgi:putative ABC transport system ATP-binding protein
MQLLEALNDERGITVTLVTHEPEMAGYARRVLHFVDGLVDADHQNGGGGLH